VSSGEDRGELNHRAVGGQRVSRSRVPPGGEVSSKVPAKGAVRCQRTEPGAGRKEHPKRDSHNVETGHSKAFWDDDETGTRP